MSKKTKIKETQARESDIEEFKARQALKKFVCNHLEATNPDQDIPLYELLHMVGDDPAKSLVEDTLDGLLNSATMRKVTRIFSRATEAGDGSRSIAPLYESLHFVGCDLTKSVIDSELKKSFDLNTYRTIVIGIQLGIEAWEGGDLNFELQRELAELRFHKFVRLEEKEPRVISHRLEVAEAIYDAFCDPVWAAQHLAKSMIDFPESAEILYHMARYCSLAYFFEPEDMPKKSLSLKLLDQAVALDPSLKETASKDSDLLYVLKDPESKKNGKGKTKS